MSGYRRARTVKLTWADGEFAGLEVRAKRISVGKFLKIAPLIDDLDADGQAGIDAIGTLLEQVGSMFVGWNLEDEDGTPIPCTAEALMDQDLGLIREVIERWVETIAGVPAPLERPSPSGGPSPEGSIPMDVLSPSPPS